MAMAMRKRQRDMTVPSGSLIVWMAGLVIGAGAGIVLVYHLLLASHAEATQPLRQVTTVAAPAPKPGDMRNEHAQALREAMKQVKS